MINNKNLIFLISEISQMIIYFYPIIIISFFDKLLEYSKKNRKLNYFSIISLVLYTLFIQ